MKMQVTTLKNRVFDMYKKVIMFIPHYAFKKRICKFAGTDFPVTEFKDSDNFSHRNSCIEWWYFSGILDSPSRNCPLGVNVTFFRIKALFKGRVIHISITDPECIGTENRNKSNFRTFRNKFIYAGWYPTFLDAFKPSHIISIFNNNLSYNAIEKKFILKVKTGDIDLMLDMKMEKSTFMSHGNNGIVGDIFLKGGSYYYSIPDLKSNGKLAYSGRNYDVTGKIWFDHQWGNFSLEDISWQWFSLRFDDNDLHIMIYDFNKESDGKFIGDIKYKEDAEGIENISITPGNYIRLKNGRSCPTTWNLVIMAGNGMMSANIESLFNDQFINSLITPSYWEGMCKTTGEVYSDINLKTSKLTKGEKFEGFAYVEVTGLG